MDNSQVDHSRATSPLLGWSTSTYSQMCRMCSDICPTNLRSTEQFNVLWAIAGSSSKTLYRRARSCQSSTHIKHRKCAGLLRAGQLNDDPTINPNMHGVGNSEWHRACPMAFELTLNCITRPQYMGMYPHKLLACWRKAPDSLPRDLLRWRDEVEDVGLGVREPVAVQSRQSLPNHLTHVLDHQRVEHVVTVPQVVYISVDVRAIDELDGPVSRNVRAATGVAAGGELEVRPVRTGFASAAALRQLLEERALESP
mmetsp:Transcript_26003/g.83944  ORF Transcript_26003/g.83944 Transcript_26003/m.83944 type:complete len:255 (-) Transcript_26003:1975-2739(-)